jgi:hypothetical protein
MKRFPVAISRTPGRSANGPPEWIAEILDGGGAIADALGVGHQTIGRDIGPNGPSGDQNALENWEPSGPNGPPSAADDRLRATQSNAPPAPS